MGLFGFIGKAVSKVARIGLNQVTQGLSEKAIKAIKSTGQAKAMAKAIQARQVTEKQAVAAMKLAPSMATPTMEKVGVGLMRGIATPKKKATRKKKAAKVTKTKKASGRKVPKGGLDLAAISRAWNAAGKPGTWLGYIKSNPIKKA